MVVLERINKVLLPLYLGNVCVSPIYIKNTNFGNTTELTNLLSDTKSRMIPVPCGVCGECLMKRQSDIVQRARCLSLDHYIFFCTLTYNRESLPHIALSNGRDIPFADVSDVQKMFKRIRKDNLFTRPFKYFFVSERGKKGRPHFHGLIFISKSSKDDKLLPAQLETSVRNTLFNQWKRNYGSDRSPVWKPLFSYRTKYVAGKRFSNFDCHYVVPHSTEHGSDDVAFYVTKYVLKPSEYERRLQQALRLNLDDSEYFNTWRIVKSRCFCSKGFGAYTDVEEDYIKDCISRSSDDPNGFQFINADGSKSRLARYYRKYIDLDSALANVAARGGPLSVRDVRDVSKIDLSLQKSSSIVRKVSERDIIDFLPDE